MPFSPRIANEIARLMRDPDALRHEAPGNERERHYDPYQPRVPAGHRDGGQWTRTVGNIIDAAAPNDQAQFEPASERDPQQPPLLLVQRGPRPNPKRGPGPLANPGLLIGAIWLGIYKWRSARNGPDRQTIIEFRARGFDPTVDDIDIQRVETLNRDQVGNRCPAFADVQRLTDGIDAQVRSDSPDLSAQQHGTAVHTRLAHTINGGADPAAARLMLRAEVSRHKSQWVDARYGEKGSIRIDVLEYAGRGIVCVYDIKTGDRDLSFPRMVELARHAH